MGFLHKKTDSAERFNNNEEGNNNNNSNAV